MEQKHDKGRPQPAKPAPKPQAKPGSKVEPSKSPGPKKN